MIEMYSKLNFGKYKNQKVQDILIKNPTYLKWALDNVKPFSRDLSPNVKLLIEEKFETYCKQLKAFIEIEDEDEDEFMEFESQPNNEVDYDFFSENHCL